MELLKVDTIEDARQKLWERIPFPVKRTQILPLEEAVGAFLAEDVKAEENIPAFDRSTVDGYAVLARDTHGASESIPVFLDVLEEVAIGHPAEKTITSGFCSYVPTGGMIPPGADAMVMVEYTELPDAYTAAIGASVAAGSGIVKKGEDAKKGEVLLKAGTKLGAGEIGTLAAAGVRMVPCVRPLKVWILSTGDELAEPGTPLLSGQVYDINTWALNAAAESMGLKVLGRRHLEDDRESILEAVQQAMAEADLVLTSGGSSKGKKDMTSDIFASCAKPGVFVHGLAVKPGKPTILASDDASATMLVGLPGHPAAALMVFRQLIGWLWDRITGNQERILMWGVMDTNLASAPGKTTCQLVEVEMKEDGAHILPLLAKSGLITPMTRAAGYIRVDRNCEGLKKGERVAVYPLG